MLFYVEYEQRKHSLEEKIYNEMRLCSYNLKCDQFTLDFVPLESKKLYQLHHTSKEIFALFSIPKNDTYALKLVFSHTQHQQLLIEIQNQIILYYVWALLVIGVISALFSLYTLYPLRRALYLTQEFSRDILHDLNTPLSALRLNVRLLNPIPDDEKKIDRIERSIDTIVSLGNNLRSYLEHHEYQQEKLEIKTLVQEQIRIYEKLYPSLVYTIKGDSFTLYTHKDALVRIFDNLLSNASKYNHFKGTVDVTIDAEHSIVHIQDSGKGIRYPKKIFERFYKEQDRGIGIGLHIVKKFCDELKIPIEVKSTPNVGSIFSLFLGALTLR